VQLVLAGPEGWLMQSIYKTVNQLDLKNHVILPGYVADEDKAALISGAIVFAYPSLYEGFGFPVLEAQACGTPLIASTSSSLPEVAGEGAILVDPEDENAIRTGLLHLLGDEGLRKDCVEKGYRNLKRFSWEQTASTVLKVIEKVLA
jgi:glycosyltransferase involved in cell wall biosynthesis